MNLVKKRETPIQNIAYIAIMSAINVLFVTISNFLPILFLILVFVLPLTSVIVTILCKKSYLPLYFIVTFLLCFSVNLGFGIYDTFIYVLPALITGILFGLLIEKKVPAILILVAISIVQFGLTYLTFYILDKFIIQVNFYESLYKLFGLTEFAYKPALTLIFTYIIAQIQVSLTYILVKYEVIRIGLEVNLEFKNKWLLYIPTVVFGILSVISYYTFPFWTILFVLMSLTVITYQFINLILSRRMWVYILLVASVIIFVFTFAFLYQYIAIPNQLVLLNIFFALITIIDILLNYCFKDKGKKIE